MLKIMAVAPEADFGLNCSLAVEKLTQEECLKLVKEKCGDSDARAMQEWMKTMRVGDAVTIRTDETERIFTCIDDKTNLSDIDEYEPVDLAVTDIGDM